MAKCKNCGTDIPDGLEYCEECLSKLNTAEDSESYLDSLLSAVMTDEPERREVVYPKKEASSLVSVSEEPARSELFFESEPEQASEEDVWDDFMKDFMTAPEEETSLPLFDEAEPEVSGTESLFDEAEPEESGTESSFDEIESEEAPMEDAFGTFFDGEEDLPDLNNYSIFGDVDEGTVDRMLAEELEEEIPEAPLFDSEPEPVTEENSSYDAFPDLFGGDDIAEFYEDDAEEAEEVEEEVPASEFSDVEDLFGMLQDERGADAPEELVMAEPEIISASEFDEASDSFSGVVEEEVPASEFGDFADLFGGSEESAAEPVVEEVPVTEFGEFSDLFGETAATEQPEEEVPVQEFGDFSDLFSGLGDDAGDMFECGAEPEVIEESEEAATMKAQPQVAKASGGRGAAAATKKSEKNTEKKQPGRFSVLFHKLFDDVKLDPAKIKKPPTPEELEAQKKAKQEEKERSKEEKEALLAEKKAQEKQEKMEKQRVKNEAKAQKKAKKMEEAKLLLEEIQSTRINRAGASIIFIFFIMIAVLVIVGTNLCSYSIGIRNAERQFNKKEYTKAYNEIYGLDVKDEDLVLYDRITTVMYVQKQLNSYYNYYGMKDQPRALDSLLKGLSRYEKYIELAIELDVDSDLDSVRNKILEEIELVFGMSEQEAMSIIQSDSRAEYSQRVYEAVGELN